MKLTRFWLSLSFFLLAPALYSVAQKSKTTKPKTPVTNVKKTKPDPPIPTPDGATNEKKVKDMVTFLEYMLNTLGSSGTSSRDKDVLITESYSKIFRDGNVQIEDDLDDEREIATNKSVVAYLKDVDFFFTDVKFEFAVETIERGENPNNPLYYKVTLKRNLKGTTASGKPVNNTVPRYIEVNYNAVDQDLKIASIYTHEIDQKGAVLNWWKQLSLEWQTIFRQRLGNSLGDSLNFEEIQKVLLIDTLDISNNRYIRNIQPLAQLSGLHVLRLANTQIADISPVRNLTSLTELNLFNSQVADLSSLKYCDKLVKLTISQIPVTDISVLQKLPHLQSLQIASIPATDFTSLSTLTELNRLNMAKTSIQNLSSLQSLNQLTEIDLSSTPIQDLSSLAGLKNLKMLDIDSTHISNLSSLTSLDQLKVLHANFTAIADLQPLSKLAHLEVIYCDKTKVDRKVADLFAEANPKVLVVFDSEDMLTWWASLNDEWKNIFSTVAGISIEPTKGELAKLTRIDSINLAASRIDNLEPLRKILKLRSLVVSGTGVSDLTPLQDHGSIEFLDISQTDVTDLFPLSRFTRLEVLKADKSKIQSVQPLFGIASLRKVYVDETALHDITAREFLEKAPACLLVYKTIHINRWWGKLSEEWRQVFRSQMGSTPDTSREGFHRLLELESFHFKDAPVSDLTALSEFVRLTHLEFSGTAVSDLTPLTNLKGLLVLHATKSPLQKLEALSQLKELIDLDISDTPIDELKVIAGLPNLKTFNCSGTQIKRLDPLSALPALEYLDCSNTRVSNLEPITYRSLKTIKCYNTKVSAREIEAFKKANPKCTVVYYR